MVGRLLRLRVETGAHVTYPAEEAALNVDNVLQVKSPNRSGAPNSAREPLPDFSPIHTGTLYPRTLPLHCTHTYAEHAFSASSASRSAPDSAAMSPSDVRVVARAAAMDEEEEVPQLVEDMREELRHIRRGRLVEGDARWRHTTKEGQVASGRPAGWIWHEQSAQVDRKGNLGPCLGHFW